MSFDDALRLLADFQGLVWLELKSQAVPVPGKKHMVQGVDPATYEMWRTVRDIADYPLTDVDSTRDEIGRRIAAGTASPDVLEAFDVVVAASRARHRRLVRRFGAEIAAFGPRVVSERLDRTDGWDAGGVATAYFVAQDAYEGNGRPGGVTPAAPVVAPALSGAQPRPGRSRRTSRARKRARPSDDDPEPAAGLGPASRRPELHIRVPLEGSGRIVFDAASLEDELRLRSWLRRSGLLDDLAEMLVELLDDLDRLGEGAA